MNDKTPGRTPAPESVPPLTSMPPTVREDEPLQELIANLTRQRNDARATAHDLREDCEKLSADVDRLTRERDDALSFGVEMTRTNGEHLARIRELERERDQLTADANRIATERNTLNHQLAENDRAATRQAQDLSALVEELEAERDALRVNNTRIAQANVTVADKLKQAREAVTALAVEWEGEADRDDALAMDPDNEPSAAEDYHDSAMVHRSHAAALRKLAAS